MDRIFDEETERLDEINEKLKLISRRSGLTFGTDAYVLSAFAGGKKGGRAVDLGCGTGVISLLLASREKYDKIYSFEIQPEYAELTERNVRLNGLESKIEALRADVRDVTVNDTSGEADAVIMNPPYMKADSGRGNGTDDMNAARREVNGTIYDFCAAAGRLLKSGGAMYAVYRPERLVDLTDAMRRAGVEPKKLMFMYQTLSSEPSLVFVEGKKGASSSVIITRPLIVYKDGTREYTDDMNRIYEEFSTTHLTERGKK